MRTEEDLRNALERIAARAPDFTPVIDDEAAVRRAQRRRTPLVLATVMATAAAAIGGPILVEHLRDTSAQPAGEQAATSWRNWLTLTAPAGMVVNPRAYEANRQVYQLAGVGSPWARWCLLTLHRNGDFNPAKIPASSPRIDVNGLAGRLITMPNGEPIVPFPVGYAMSSTPVRPVSTVAWQPGMGIWGLLSCERQRELGTREVPTIDAPSDSDNDLAVAVAKTVTAAPQRLSAPFKIGYVPNGLRTHRVLDKTANFSGDSHTFRVVFTDGNPATGAKKPKQEWSGEGDHPPQKDAGSGSLWGPHSLPGEDLEISYSTDKFWNSKTRTVEHDPVDLMIHGWEAWYTGEELETKQHKGKPGQDNGLRMERNGVAISVHFLGGQADEAQLRRIAESLTLPEDPLLTAQWFDADTAIPH